MLEFTAVDAGYGQLDVLFSISLPVPSGKITAVLGPNGAGKTTALKVAAGLIAPRRGSVRLRNEEIAGLTPRAIARKGLCLIPEGRGIFPSLTVRENLALQAELSRLPLAGVEEAAYGQFPVLGRRRKQLAGTLSGGEQHMLALSRALTSDPQVILIDEISMGLAPNLIENLFEVVVGLARNGRTIVLVEQLAEFVMEIADFVAVISKGTVAAIGQPDDVRRLLQEVYLGSGQGALDRETVASITDDVTAWVTPTGTLRHRGVCPVVATRPDVRPAREDDDLEDCAICATSEETSA